MRAPIAATGKGTGSRRGHRLALLCFAAALIASCFTGHQGNGSFGGGFNDAMAMQEEPTDFQVHPHIAILCLHDAPLSPDYALRRPRCSTRIQPRPRSTCKSRSPTPSRICR
eukprot:COSAG01_NODE_2815_length_7021_cov_7.545363_8_plen_112_part_00